MDMYGLLSLYIENPAQYLPLTVKISKFLKLITSKKDTEKLVFSPVDDPFDRVARCVNCELSTSREKYLQKKLENKYAQCCNVFHFVPDPDTRLWPIDMIFTAQLMDNYKEITDFVFENGELLGVDKEEKFFKKFKLLNSITLKSNKLKEFPSSILNAKRLNRLSIQNNPIKNFNSNSRNIFKHLKNLEILELINCPITLSDLGMSDSSSELIKLPETLRLLRMSSLRLNCIPFSLVTCKNSLKELYFIGAKWISVSVSLKEAQINRENLIDILEASNGLNSDQVNKLFDYFDTDKNSTLNGEEITKMNGFLYRKFPRLGDNFSPEEFNDADSNKSNKFIQSYMSIFELKNLVVLDLSYQAIKFLPDQIESLACLEKLYLESCVELQTISSKVTKLTKLNEFNLNDCISLKQPPAEVNFNFFQDNWAFFLFLQFIVFKICRRGFEPIITYLKRLSSGSVKSNRTKLMLVGLGDAGNEEYIYIYILF